MHHGQKFWFFSLLIILKFWGDIDTTKALCPTAKQITAPWPPRLPPGRLYPTPCGGVCPAPATVTLRRAPLGCRRV